MLSRLFDFKGATLAEAVKKTFENRKTPITAAPAVFQRSFAEDEDKQVQWTGFIKKAKLDNSPGAFGEVVAAVRVFLEPVTVSLSKQQSFRGMWKAPGPWE